MSVEDVEWVCPEYGNDGEADQTNADMSTQMGTDVIDQFFKGGDSKKSFFMKEKEQVLMHFLLVSLSEINGFFPQEN